MTDRGGHSGRSEILVLGRGEKAKIVSTDNSTVLR